MKNLLIGAIVIFAVLGGIFYFGKDSDTTPVHEPIIIKGSDTEVQLVSSLAEAFNAVNTGANISVTGGGSGVGIAALLNGEIDIANSSRPMKEEELETAEKNGLDIQEFIVARDGLSIIVHPDNTVTSLTLDQIGKIYRGDISDWKDVGRSPGPIVLYGRQSTSGTYTFFRDTVLKSDYAKNMKNMEGSQQIVDAVTTDANGIGYVGVGYVRDGDGAPRSEISILLVKKDAQSEAVSPLDVSAVLAGRYPIFRPIYQYLKEVPRKGSVIDEFLRFEISREGEVILDESGFYSLVPEDKAANAALFDRIK